MKQSLSFENYLREFLTVLITVRGLSANTIKSYENDLLQWYSFCQDRSLPIHDLNKITEETLSQYMHHLADRSLSTTSINRKLSALKMFFLFLWRQGYVDSNLVENIKGPKGFESLPRTISSEDMQTLLSLPFSMDNFSQTRDLCLLELMYATGMRVSELVTISYPPLVSDRTMLLIRGKGNKERILAIHDRCKQILDTYMTQRQKYLHKRQSPWLFFSPHDVSRHLSRQSCNAILRRLSQKAGLQKHIHPHLIRHTVASQLLNNGMNLRYLQYFLGHSSINTVQIYTHILQDKLVEVMDKHPLQSDKKLLSESDDEQ